MKHNVINPLPVPVDWVKPTPLDHYTSHPSPSEDVLDYLETDMRERGWNGPPIVINRAHNAITGTHRIHAWENVYADTIPCVYIEDIVNHHEIEYDYLDLHEIALIANDYLPRNIAVAYGIDLH